MKILALNGLLGYGYSEAALQNAFLEPPDFIGADGGSTDPGPYYLGKGIAFTDRAAVKRDVSLALAPALAAKAPFIVGTAGGSGSAAHLDWLRDIFLEIAGEQRLSFRMALIYTDVGQSYLLQKLESGHVLPLGALPLSAEAIRNTCRAVSQIGPEPIMEALRAGADVVLAGRACDTAIYAAPCLLRGFDPGLSFHMAKIMECGAMCASPMAAADVMQGYMYDDYFELCPASPRRRCTVQNVAAHTMYEQGDPYRVVEPGGTAELSGCRYEQVTERRVRVSGSRFLPAGAPTLKIEGVRLAGYRAVSIAGINDPLSIRAIDTIFEGAKRFAAEATADTLSGEDYRVMLRKYGTPLDPAAAPAMPNHSLGIVLDVVGKTQAVADRILPQVRSRML
ncbi:MAG: acyclic terpene utilization AtuA family protein, partial [Clostridia bacterium]|nr:acyclic terpene utilization AtuA family protein [Clostridia bacterium]